MWNIRRQNKKAYAIKFEKIVSLSLNNYLTTHLKLSVNYETQILQQTQERSLEKQYVLFEAFRFFFIVNWSVVF